MYSVIYEFDKIQYNTKSVYIFQPIKNRKLSNIYHSHDFYEWIFVFDGSCTQIVNEKEYFLDKNTCFLLRPGDRHKFIRQSDNINMISLSVKKEEFESFLNVFNFQGKMLTLFYTKTDLRQSRVLFDLYYANKEYEYKLMLSILIKIYIDTYEEKSDIPSSLKFAVNEMLKTENLKVGVDKFVELSNYSQSHLSRLIKKHFNITLHEYILNTRLESAYNALIFSNVNIEELSESLGYASFSHFNKIFKKKYGITPSALRKNFGSWTT